LIMNTKPRFASNLYSAPSMQGGRQASRMFDSGQAVKPEKTEQKPVKPQKPAITIETLIAKKPKKALIREFFAEKVAELDRAYDTF